MHKVAHSKLAEAAFLGIFSELSSMLQNHIFSLAIILYCLLPFALLAVLFFFKMGNRSIKTSHKKTDCLSCLLLHRGTNSWVCKELPGTVRNYGIRHSQELIWCYLFSIIMPSVMPTLNRHHRRCLHAIDVAPIPSVVCKMQVIICQRKESGIALPHDLQIPSSKRLPVG